jgi:hypothetical protein
MRCHLCVGAARASYVAALLHPHDALLYAPFATPCQPAGPGWLPKKSIVNVGESSPRAEHVAS